MISKDALATGVDRIVRTWFASMDRLGVALPTGSIMVAAPQDMGLLKWPSAGSLTGQARALLHIMGSTYDEESKEVSGATVLVVKGPCRFLSPGPRGLARVSDASAWP